ncbi:hypothetical protein FRD01_00640 [Microvenator marinus]|uniref:Uncharacterized protein n=1 Tax=Microvenator marinus TaxID=2600177 RepID=A0A5B8XL16_9DELT|nr:hypothetical protein [Microvenator marinus]QED25791.1 hypothetical protein FRD01_00640 [Microvenator marinus]
MRFWSACLTIFLLICVFSGNSFSQTQIVYQDQENQADKQSDDTEEAAADEEKGDDSEAEPKAKAKKKGEKTEDAEAEESDTESDEELKSTAGGIDLDEVPTKVIDL